MSYEGYNEFLCTKGHYFTLDSYHCLFLDSVKCPYCNEKYEWFNAVDQTNDEGYAYTEERLRVRTPEQCKTCGECGHVKLSAQATYHTPTEDEIKQYDRDRNAYYDKIYAE